MDLCQPRNVRRERNPCGRSKNLLQIARLTFVVNHGIGLFGNRLSKKDDFGFKQGLTIRTFRWKLLQGGHGDFPRDPAIETGEEPVCAMEFDNVFAPGGLMEVIHVLGNHGVDQPHLLHQCQTPMSGVGLRLDDEFQHFLQHDPDPVRLRPEGITMGIFLRVILAPERLFTPQIGDSTFPWDSSPGKATGLFFTEDILACAVDAPLV